MYDKELIEKYRDINVEHDEWSECVITPFKEAMLDIGVDVDSVLFTKEFVCPIFGILPNIIVVQGIIKHVISTFRP